MMNVINTTGMSGMGSGIIWLHMHWFFGAFAIVGFVLLVIWAAKYLAKNKISSLAIWLLSIGIIGTIITAVPAMTGLQGMMNTMRGGCSNEKMMNMPMMESMMKKMMNMQMEHNEGSNMPMDGMPAKMDSMEPTEMQEMMDESLFGDETDGQNMMNE